jgi:hypothetical protein
MSTLVAEVKALYEAVQKAQAIIKKVASSAELQAQFDEAVVEVNREMGQVSYAVAQALVAHALGRPPSSQEVQQFLSAAIGDPAFPARAYRLIGEARKTASDRRRAFLASMLLGLPFTKIADDERDRIDMTVERMTVEDAELLMAIFDNIRTPQDLGHRSFGPTGVLVLTPVDTDRPRPTVHIVTPDPTGRADEVRVPFPRGVFESLKLLGCVETGAGISTEGGVARYHLLLTDLGGTVGRAIKEVRPGLSAEAVAPASAARSAKARPRV